MSQVELTKHDRKILEAAAEQMGTTLDKCDIHISVKPGPCDHEWNNDGCNPEYCEKCGVSFIHHIFMECP